jgi:hypothetical protein
MQLLKQKRLDLIIKLHQDWGYAPEMTLKAMIRQILGNQNGGKAALENEAGGASKKD